MRREAAFMKSRAAASMTRAGASILVVVGFALGAVSTLALLALVGELGQRYPDGPGSARLEPGVVARADSGGAARASRPESPGALARADAEADAAAPSYDTLVRRGPILPVVGVDPTSIQDTFEQKRGTDRKHEATDIIAPRGTPVVAFDDGLIRKLFESKQGGLTVYQFDGTETFCYYYAHLDRYAEGLEEGMFVRRGDRIGYVGTTGNAPIGTPHLHFAIFRLGPEKRWWQGTPINPYPILMALARR